jgi:hypothetical protein
MPHRRLLSKLSSYGIDQELINWIQAFLCGRTQCVKINKEYSDSKAVLSGIPQGTVLGPVLFVIFINDLPNVCNNLCNLFMFADDAKLYKTISNQIDSDMLNNCFLNILNWCDNWLMKLNVSKCKVLSLCCNSSNIITYTYGSTSLMSNSVTLMHEEKMKDLGVTTDKELSFDMHIYDKINIANRMLGIIKRNFKDVDKFTFIILYKSFVQSQVEYAVSVWNPYKLGVIRDIEKIQKRATKNIQGCRHMSYKDRLTYLELPSLKYRRLRGDMIEVYKILNFIYAPVLAPALPRNADVRTRGNLFKLIVNRCKLDIRKYSFCNRVVNFWNSLPNTVVSSVSVNIFLNNLDKYSKLEGIYYDFEQ